jgi:hypothetical protein
MWWWPRRLLRSSVGKINRRTGDRVYPNLMAHPFRPLKEVAPMLAMWGKIAPVVASLIVARPALAARLMLAPSRIVHALAAYVQHAHAASHTVGEIADALGRQHVRDLLASAIPNIHPRLLGILGRMGPAVADLTFYRRLNDALHGTAADLILGADKITENHLHIVAEIVADPVLLAARKTIGSSRSNLESLQLAIRYLRATGLASDIEVLQQGSGWRAILRRISSDLGRARAPSPPFVIPAGFRQIESVADLWRMGTVLNNCVASLSSGGEEYVDDLINGDAVYIADAKPTMLACIRRVSGPNFWVLAETTTGRVGSDLMTARLALRSALISTIADAGGALLDQSPLAVIRSIAWRAERVEPMAGGNLGDLEDVA